MSNFLAPATVTASLALLLEEQIALDVTDFTFSVFTDRPDQADENTAHVNIYLYQVTPNPQWRNADLPTRNRRGHLRQRPRMAVDLHYILTFGGVDDELQPQRLLGSTLQILNGQPVLTRDWIDYARTHTDFPYLANSDLGNEIERVKFTPQAFSLEELSKLWSVFFQTEYNLSIAYVASVIFLEPQEQPESALPVLQRTVAAVAGVSRPAGIDPGSLDGVALWLRSDRGITFDADGVLLWEDQSGNDRHARQLNGPQRPRYLAHGIGNLPVLHFDGADDHLVLDWDLSGSIATVTVCVLARTSSASTQAAISFADDEFWELQVGDGTATPFARWITADSTATVHELSATCSIDDTQWHVLFVDFDAAAGDDKRFFVDGVEAGLAAGHAGAIGGAGPRTGLIGAGPDGGGTDRFLDGDLAEILVFDRILDADERDQLEQYFADRYRKA